LLHHPELTATIIQSLKGSVDLNKEECVPLHYASILISKGFTCSLLEIGINLEMHLRVVGSLYHKGLILYMLRFILISYCFLHTSFR